MVTGVHDDGSRLRRRIGQRLGMEVARFSGEVRILPGQRAERQPGTRGLALTSTRRPAGAPGGWPSLPHHAGASGSAQATGVAEWSSSAIMEIRCRRSTSGRDPWAGRPRRPARPVDLVTGLELLGRQTKRHRDRHSLRLSCRIVLGVLGTSNGSASRSGSSQSGSSSWRQISPICQRGEVSPGYHLPWLR